MDIKKQYMMLNDSLKKHAKIFKNILSKSYLYGKQGKHDTKKNKNSELYLVQNSAKSNDKQYNVSKDIKKKIIFEVK